MRVIAHACVLHLLTVALLLCFPRGSVAQPTFAASVDAVRLDVFVRLDVPSPSRLTVNDFEVLEHGKRHDISLVQSTDVPINVVFVLDTSRSTRGAAFSDTVDAVNALLGGLRPGDRVSVLTFDDLVHAHVGLTRDVKKARTAVTALPTIGRSSILDSLVAGLAVASGAAPWGG